ncbi:hypothetical protein HWV62_28262 [Athelia sp. TMB]|nr:hypothetical protein HWV62_28262 [Athelia sp. TMB]
MGRWTQYDEDAYRLPEGFTRTGYDADSQTYFFTDTKTGKQYHSGPRQRFGVLAPTSSDSSNSQERMFAPSRARTIQRKFDGSTNSASGSSDTFGREGSLARAKTVSGCKPSRKQAEESTATHVRSFSDFLPATSITFATDSKPLPSIPPKNPRSSSPELPGDRFRRLVRLGTMPRLSNMGSLVRRTMSRKRGGREQQTTGEDEPVEKSTLLHTKSLSE